MKLVLILGLFCRPSVLAAESAGFSGDYSLPVYAEINFRDISEGSSLLKSPGYPGVYWTLNDSDNPPIIYPLDAKGGIIKPEWVKNYKGLKILDAHNIDWEWMTSDDSGHLLIGDTGNNYNYRRDLSIYELAEPNPYYAFSTGIIAKYPVKYPDQTSFPPDEKHLDFDAEAAYFYEGHLYMISKDRSDPKAKIYKFGKLKPWEENIPEKVRVFDFISMVTDAALSPDKKKLAVLTYDYIWLFENPEKGDFFSGKALKKAVRLGQCEGIAFDGDALLVSNEVRKVFRVELKEIK